MPTTTSASALIALRKLGETRRHTEELAAPLSAEDQQVQSMPDCSPTKWHRAHTTWFFEEFVLSREEAYECCNPAYRYLFNSYYESVGDRQPRPQRGLLTRPSMAEITAYREHVDSALERILPAAIVADPEIADLVDLGINHEEQHQELLLMDIKHLLSRNPLRPGYLRSEPASPRLEDSIHARSVSDITWTRHEGGNQWVGHDGTGFHFDNEAPRHLHHLPAFEIADRLVTCGQWLDFIEDGGYTRHEFWHMEGWLLAQAEDWQAPLYWERGSEGWNVYTLEGVRPVNEIDPVVHISWFEAEAFARWAGCRLPTESEWETVAGAAAAVDSRLASDVHPRYRPEHAVSGVSQLIGEVWQWTSSAYSPYPGFIAAPGAVGEYNGKFMVNQYVLRGGAAITPVGHSRVTYRNFYPASARWAFSGLRLARTASMPQLESAQLTSPVTVLLDEAQWSSHLEQQTRDGLMAAPPHTPPVWFYDERGSQLFDQITELEEYYVTEAERRILIAHADDIARLSRATTLVELGSGTSDKTRILISALRRAETLSTFVPLDCSEAFLREAVNSLVNEFPGLRVHGVVGDFSQHLSQVPVEGHRMIAFLGSTIGNFEPAERLDFLRHVAESLESGETLLLGTDLVKDPVRLERAYNDAQGVTAEFNLNSLDVMNRSLGSDFDRSAYRHEARWIAEHSRIEMRLVATRDQTVTMPGMGRTISIQADEWIRSEVSTKFTTEQVANELELTGFELLEQWTDSEGDFLVTLARRRA